MRSLIEVALVVVVVWVHVEVGRALLAGRALRDELARRPDVRP